MTNRLDELWKKKPQQPPPAPPASVTPITAGGGYAAKALAGEVENVRTAVEGRRNHTLNVAAVKLGGLVASGHLARPDVEEALTAAALAAGLTPSETRGTIASGLTFGLTQPRDVPEAVTVEPLVEIVDDLDQTEVDTFWGAHPLLTHIHDYARARRVSPWAVLGVTLCRVAATIPPLVLLPPIIGSHASLNLFIALVGPSGSGKGAAEGAATDCLDVGQHVDTLNAGSGEGIAHAYMKRTKDGPEQIRQSVLFTIPEIDTLGALGSRQGSTLLPELRKAWSGEGLGFAYADPTKNLPVPKHKYRLCLVAGVQPGRGHVLLDDATGGTPQRFVWLPATDPDAPDVAPPCPEQAKWTAPVWGRLPTTAGRYAMPVCGEAVETIEKAHLARTRGDGDALDGHALLCRLKVAAVVAVMLGNLEVTERDWWLADVVARKSDATRGGVAQVLAQAKRAANQARALADAERAATVEEYQADRGVKRVSRWALRYLARHSTEGEWVPGWRVRQAASSRDREHLQEALGRLLEAGQVEVEESRGGHRYRPIGGVS